MSAMEAFGTIASGKPLKKDQIIGAQGTIINYELSMLSSEVVRSANPYIRRQAQPLRFLVIRRQAQPLCFPNTCFRLSWNTCSEAEPTPGHGDFQCASNSCKLKYDYARRPFVSAKKVSVVRRNPWLLEHVFEAL